MQRAVGACLYSYNPEDKDLLVQVIRNLVGDKALRVHLGNAAKSYALQHIDKTQALKALEIKLNEVSN